MAVISVMLSALCRPSSAAEAPHALTDLSPITLSSGINTVPKFTPDGRSATISLGWRENGDAHGYHVMFILASPAADAPWNVVEIERPGREAGMSDIVIDNPHTGDDIVRSFRLARGKIDGDAATLLLIATRGLDPEGGIPAPSQVTYEVFRLTHAVDQVGTPPDYFHLVQTIKSPTKFCNADMALVRQFGLPMPKGYEGPQTADGC
jgi:hypothetical protein